MRISGKVGLITGGAGGLGKAFAIALLQKGAAGICLLDVSRSGEDIALELSKRFKPASVKFRHCDVSDYSQLKSAFAFTKNYFGQLDIICNNAGFVSKDHDLKRSIKAFRVNLEAVYFGTTLGQTIMDKANGGNGGVIINIASMAGFVPVAESMVYTATKHGVVGLSRAAGNPVDCEYTGVKVNCLCPSFTETPILDQSPGIRDFLATQHHAVLRPELIAEGFIQLIEDDSKNGAVMRITPQKGIDYKEYGRFNKRTDFETPEAVRV